MQVSRGFAKYPPTMGELDSAAVVTIEPLSRGKKEAETPQVLTMKKVKGENECFQSVESINKRVKLSIRKAKASVQVR